MSNFAKHAITSLWLENYRNYNTFRLEFDAKPVVIRGPNGAGKTNLLEAISLLAPGRGFRNAKLSDVNAARSERQNSEALPSGFTVSAKVKRHDDINQIGTAYQQSAGVGRDQRVIHINAEKKHKQSVLAEYVHLLWLTPAMDQLFVSGFSDRRKWLDRLVYTFDASHAARVSAYEQAMRERNKLLKQFKTPDPQWLLVLERNMAGAGVAIVIARQEAVNRMLQSMEKMPGIFPKAGLWLEGDTETLLESGASALEAEQKLAEQLEKNRAMDAQSGRALRGVHKTLFQIRHLEKGVMAEQGSTGEQKAMLLSIVMAVALAREQWLGAAPIVLFDEIVAHLDVEKQNCLFDLISQAGIQAWVTGTDASDFSNLLPHATLLQMRDGMIE